MYVHDADLQHFVQDGINAGTIVPREDACLRTERRQEQRYEVQEKAYMHSVYPVSSNRRSVTVLDFCRTGLKVEVILPELLGASVRVHWRDMFVIGEVRYCREEGEAYHLGIRVDAVLYAPSSRLAAGDYEHGIIRRPV